MNGSERGDEMNMVLVFSFSAFIYCIIWLGLILFNKNTLMVQERLNDIGSGMSKEQKYEKRIKNKPRLNYIYISASLKNDIYMTGIKMKPEEFVLIWVFLAIVPATMFYTVTESVVRSVASVLIGASAPPFYLKSAIKKRQVKFEKQLGDSLQVLANGLRAGFSFSQAVENLSKDMPDPLGSEFRTASRELLLGVDIETVLSKIAEHMKSEDMRLLTAAVMIQQQVGGNLAEILDIISQTIRDRLAIKRSVRTLTAQGRISGQIVGIIPLAMLLIISIISPDYTNIFFTTTYGQIMLIVSLVMECIGFLVIHKIVDIKF